MFTRNLLVIVSVLLATITIPSQTFACAAYDDDAKNHLRIALSLTETYSAYQQGRLDYWQSVDPSTVPFAENLEANITAKQSVLKGIALYKSHTQALIAGNILAPAEELLEFALRSRANYLAQRKVRTDLRSPFDHRTDPGNLERLAGANPQSLEIANSSIYQYQYASLQIYHIYKYMIKNQISINETCKFLLQLSPGLWPLLNDETDDLSHPDAMLEEDGVLALQYLLKTEEIEGPCLMLGGKGLTIKYPGTKYEKTKLEKEKAVKNRDAKPRVVIGLDANDEFFMHMPDLEPLKPLPALPGWLDPQFFVKSKLPEESQREKSKKKRTKKAMIVSSVEVAPMKESPIVDPPIAAAAEIISEAPVAEPAIVAAADTSSSDKVIDDGCADLLAEAERERYLLPPPKGMRQFHPEMSGSAVAPRQLKSSLQGDVNQVFERRSITYGAFSSLWKKLGGRIKTQGSHRTLFDANGAFMGTTFAHNEGFSYDDEGTRKYLRHALSALGYSRK